MNWTTEQSELENWEDHHISSDLRVESWAPNFHISGTLLYKISQPNLNASKQMLINFIIQISLQQKLFKDIQRQKFKSCQSPNLESKVSKMTDPDRIAITLFEIFIFCPKIQPWFPEKMFDFLGWKTRENVVAKMIPGAAL